MLEKLTTAVEFIGAALIVAGVALLNIPAALIVAGALAIASSYLVSR